MLRAVLFEIDEVLLPDRAPAAAALVATCQRPEEQLGVPPGTLVAAVEAIGSATFASLDPSRLGARHGITWEQCLWGPFAGAPRELPGLAGLAAAVRHATWTGAVSACGGSPGTAQDLSARYVRERRSRFEPVPEAGALVASLRDRALLVGCLTAGASAVQRVKLRESRLESLFDAVVISGEEGLDRSDPALLRVACDRLGVEPSEALVVGPSPTRDLASAAGAGAPFVLVERGERGGPEPERVVHEPAGVLAYVDGLRAGREVRLFANRLPLAIDRPHPDDAAFQVRVGPELDELRPSVRGSSPRAAVLAALRALRARAGDAARHELGEPVDWDALLR